MKPSTFLLRVLGASLLVQGEEHGLTFTELNSLASSRGASNVQISDLSEIATWDPSTEKYRIRQDSPYAYYFIGFDDYSPETDPRDIKAYQFVWCAMETKGKVSESDLDQEAGEQQFDFHAYSIAKESYIHFRRIARDLDGMLCVSKQVSMPGISPFEQFSQAQENRRHKIALPTRISGAADFIPAVQQLTKKTMTATTQNTTSLFISHSSKDVEIVEELADLISSGIGVPLSKIVCTSLPGSSRPEWGDDAMNWIRDRMHEKPPVLAVLTDNFWESDICVCEVGAAWMVSRKLIPLLVPPLEYSDGLRGIFSSFNNCPKADVADDLDRLATQLARLTDVGPVDVERWNRRRDRYLRNTAPLMSKKRLGDTTAEVVGTSSSSGQSDLKKVGCEWFEPTGAGPKLDSFFVEGKALQDPTWNKKIHVGTMGGKVVQVVCDYHSAQDGQHACNSPSRKSDLCKWFR